MQPPTPPRRDPALVLPRRWCTAPRLLAVLLGPALVAQTQWVEVEAFPRLTFAAAAYDAARARTILFGGTASAIENDRTWEFDGVAWRRLHPALRPAARLGHVMAYDAARDRIVLFGGQNWPNVRQTFLNDTWEWDGTVWTQRLSPGSIPPERSHAALAYDPLRQRIVLFGGGNSRELHGDTWEWDGTRWLLSANAGPAARATHGLAFDPVSRRVLLFGGYGNSGSFVGTWSWDGTTWTQLTPTTSPPFSWFSHLVTDSVRNRVVLLGGDHTTVVWEWDGSDWIANGSACAALGRRGATAAAHASKPILIGGEVAYEKGGFPIYETMGDTWSWNGRTCARLVGNATPQGSYSQAMAFDRVRGETVLFGGQDARADQTWLFDGSRWTERLPALTPPERYLHAMVFDEARERVLLFGGSAYRSRVIVRRSDTWEWDGTTWLQLHPATAPLARGGHGLVYDRARRHALLFGGYDENFVYLDDTWVWDGTNWNPQQPASRPPGRVCRMVYDGDRQRTVLFGGRNAAGQLSDTWEWDGTTWSERQPANVPQMFDEFWLPALHYDEARQRTVLHGMAASRQMETWEWDGVDWQQRAGPQPPFRIRQAATFDAVRERGVMFGSLNETWLYSSEHPATFATFGTGCPGSAGTPRLTASRPWLDGSFTLDVDNLPSAATAVCVALGTSNQRWHNLPLPASLAPIGMPGCDLLVSFDVALGGFARGGRARLTLGLCACPALVGLDFYSQAFAPDLGTNALGVIVSNGGAGRVGSR